MEEVVHTAPTLAERVATLVTSSGSVTDYVWDTSEALRSWGLDEVVLRADRAYSGCIVFPLLFLFMITF